MDAKERAVKMWNDSHGMSIEEILQALERNVVEAVADERERCLKICASLCSTPQYREIERKLNAPQN